MRIDQIKLTNFKCFEEASFTFDAKFTLFVGDNGVGKTSILSAVAIALGIFEQNETIKQTIRNTERAWRKIYDDEIRLGPSKAGDRSLFRPSNYCVIEATGQFENEGPIVSWTRSVENGKRRKKAKEAIEAIENIIADAEAQKSPAPLIAYYGAGRAWLPSNERVQKVSSEMKKTQQWDAYYDCLQERIRIPDLSKWFRDEAAARDEKGGWRPGYKTVRRAILSCTPDSRDVLWDPERLEICLDIGGKTVPFSMLSDGQKTMTATVADMAIRAVTLNSFLFGDEKEIPDAPALPVVLAETPGVVLIDEIDVHLHPSWQRRVVEDLRRTFPKVQFICTTHSAQVMGEIPVIVGEEKAGKVWILGPKGPRRPSVNYADSNWNLEHQMGAEVESRNTEVGALLSAAEAAMMEQDLSRAESSLEAAHKMMGGEDGELTRLQSSLATLKKLNDADD